MARRKRLFAAVCIAGVVLVPWHVDAVRSREVATITRRRAYICGGVGATIGCIVGAIRCASEGDASAAEWLSCALPTCAGLGALFSGVFSSVGGVLAYLTSRASTPRAILARAREWVEQSSICHRRAALDQAAYRSLAEGRHAVVPFIEQQYVGSYPLLDAAADLDLHCNRVKEAAAYLEGIRTEAFEYRTDGPDDARVADEIEELFGQYRNLAQGLRVALAAVRSAPGYRRQMDEREGQRERERLERERLEEERRELERLEWERLERERVERERQRLERERLDHEREQLSYQRARVCRERDEQEMAERERLVRERAEREHRECLERDRLERDRRQREREARERQMREERERVEREKTEREHRERQEHLIRERERMVQLRREREQERLQKEREERERDEREQQERERAEREARERLDREREELAQRGVQTYRAQAFGGTTRR